MNQERLYHRAGGRRHDNSMRQLQAVLRRAALLRYLSQGSVCTAQWGWQSRAARALGVHRSTICRDWSAILRELHTLPLPGAPSACFP
jgi:hypothetical protein